MILQQRQAKRFAGWTVAEMIRLGCSGPVMRAAGVPRTVFHWILGERAWENGSPLSAARHLMELLQHPCLGLPEIRDPSARAVVPKEWRAEQVLGAGLCSVDWSAWDDRTCTTRLRHDTGVPSASHTL